jgi:hypothetical protein
MAITQNGVAGVTADQVATGSATFTNKTISLASNTVSGTLDQFNTSISDANVTDENMIIMGAI